MAFDTDTRNKLRSTVEQCRKLLCGTYDNLGGEITAQLQEYYGIQPTGEIAPLDDLELDEAGREKAAVLRDLIQHYAASDSGGGAEKAVRARAVHRLVLEQAFTVVNRLAALRMAEDPKRNIIPPCTSSGMDSDGFQLYEQTSGTDMGDRFDRYRSYLFCLFDELTLDLAPLFDRFSPQGLIFPRERVLLELLDLLNGDEVQHLWGEDETNGWVYQYWNSKEERAAMRKAVNNGAPRNSRELAVRNQFFTPRYVVQFLTDNTLGRIWYEMCRGETRLVDQCEYLVRRPHEIFMLDAGEYVSEECGEWVKEVREGNFAAAEFDANWEEITAVALAIDGYVAAEQMRCGDVHDYVRERGELAIEQGQVDDSTLLDQWLLLFSIQRGLIREGQVFDNEDSARAAKKAWEAWVIAAKAEACDPVSPSELAGLTMPLEGGMEEAHQRIYGEPLDPDIGVESWIEAAWNGDLSLLVEEFSVNNRLVAVAIPGNCFGAILGDPDFNPREDERLVEVMQSISNGCPNEDAQDLRIVWAAMSDFVWNDGSGAYGADTWDRLWSHFCLLARINTSALRIQELSQEELLNKPVFVPPRPFKDPREIRLLDPACGSMHFGLYAFDLYETIYEEAWQRGLVPDGDFDSFEDFQIQIPRLVIEHNIHGVDIDSRAAQIAGLSLWLRAQRSWKRQEVPPQNRPIVGRSNIVCAEPMPGDESQLAAFTKELHPVLAHMVRAIFEKMELAGEAGSLLKIEEEISSVVREAREAWEKIGKAEGEMFSAAELAVGDQRTGVQQELTLGEFTLEDLSAVSAVDFFDQAEDEIYALLERYAEGAVDGSYQRRLFAEDAARGFAFIDLCRKRYDAVVMNPPFGEASENTDFAVSNPNACSNIYCAFVIESMARLHERGRIGAITDRSFVVKSDYKAYREWLYSNFSPNILIDLGWEVLDANVEVCAYVISRNASGNGIFGSASAEPVEIRNRLLQSLIRFRSDVETPLRCIRFETFRNIPRCAMSYSLPDTLLNDFASGELIGNQWGRSARGMSSGKTAFACRLLWEIPHAEFGCGKKWNSVNVGGGKALFYRPPFMVFYHGQDWGCMRAFKGFSLKNTDLYWSPAIGWGKRTDLLSCQLLSSDSITAEDGQLFKPTSQSNIWMLLAFLNSKYAQTAVHAICGGHKGPGYVGNIPLPHSITKGFDGLSTIAKEGYELQRKITRLDEMAPDFICFKIGSGLSWIDETQADISLKLKKSEELLRQIDALVFQCLGKTHEDIKAIEGISPGTLIAETEVGTSQRDLAFAATSYSLGAVFGRWDIRHATGECQPPELPDPFDPLPICPPGMLQNVAGLPAVASEVPEDYPLRITWSGILVEDSAHVDKDGKSEDIVARVEDSLRVIWKDRWEKLRSEVCQLLDVREQRDYFAENKSGGKFFKDHLIHYSKSTRSAPIYWPLSTESGSYTLWIYYHRLTDQTLFACVTNFVEPKITGVTNRFQTLSDKADDRSAKEQKEWEQLESFLGELNAFRDELLRIAHLPWKPNLNDGVMITAAPLWKLFRLTAWRNKLKKCWESLEKGDYDWAHLAYTIWPERVLDTCRTDRSIAIAHDVEDLFWEKDEKGKWQPREPDEEEVGKAKKEGRLLADPLRK